ncbi:hypothetical protein TVAG_031930 [Trichomonas vaginalis G3]|uniref:Uncharacterized protein n=1 Tax=Trichomonas vaginalis (strain ATCC PRA-98 / G3) TaxID=412133 RepID=A2EUJ2_TRIV3|nr:spectrin binding [Trichomonas vaginalis G3]EAY03694.1 hypothetical protein TVAG_031930 [Trichomonas vaginalis G3]KAI5532083.1 spectrin binding [Trichomonas vaginalis G3]|eukprot:XP_001315917.1 hypothetical protein [Trichomonas vaginalis G3]
MTQMDVLSKYVDDCLSAHDINIEMQISDEIDKVIWMQNFYKLPLNIALRILKYSGKSLTEIQSRQVVDGFMRTCGIEAMKVFPYVNCGNIEQLMGQGPLQKTYTQEAFIHEPLIPHDPGLHSPKPKPRATNNPKTTKFQVPHYMIVPKNRTKSISYFKLDVHPSSPITSPKNKTRGALSPTSPRKKFVVKEEEEEDKKEEPEVIAIFSAAEASEIKTVEKLIHEKPELIHSKLNNETLLHVAMRRKDMKLSGILLRCGADKEAPNLYGSSPLYTAIYQDYAPGIDFLLSQGANVNSRNNSGNSPLHWAAECRKISAAKILLSYGANINAQNDKGETPFLIACKKGPLELVKEFLQAGADINIENKYGEKPIDVALHPDIQTEIRNHEGKKT